MPSAPRNARRFKVDIDGKRVPVDEKLFGALPEQDRKIITDFQPKGFADIHLDIQRKRGEQNKASLHVGSHTERLTRGSRDVLNIV